MFMSLWQRFTGLFCGKPRLADPNAHIREYLDHYLSLPVAPNYAVMLTGSWGAGKTHLIKGITRKLRKSGAKHVYVSLYGIRTREEFDRAVLAALYPFIYGRVAKASAQIIGGLISAARLNLRFPAEDYLSKFDADLFVFDDLERCDISVTSALGFINPFVEHGDCRVIVIANESEIKQSEQDDYRRRKEKVIGQTLALKPDLDNALPIFIRQTSNAAARKFLDSNMQIVHLVAEQSGSGNLRILQQTLWDFARFYRALPSTYLLKTRSVVALLAPFLAFATEFKAGRLNQEILQGRTLAARVLARSRNNDKPNPFDETAKRYVGVDLTDRLFSDDLLIEMFEHGMFKTESIRASLGQSTLFSDSENKIPAWRVVWEKEICEDDQVAKAIAEMEVDFKARAYVEQGVILHVFGLRLRLCDEGLLPVARATAVTECMAYVDDLETKGALTPLELYDNAPNVTAFAGLGFIEGKSEDFSHLRKYLLERQKKVLEASYPARARELLFEMASDDGLFWRRINYSNTDDTRYAGFPIFLYVCSNEFVDALLRLSNFHQRSVLLALLNRYDDDKNVGVLQVERAWLGRVRDDLLGRAKNSDAITKNRIERIVEWTIDKVLNESE